jgi:hypothetical protein
LHPNDDNVAQDMRTFRRIRQYLEPHFPSLARPEHGIPDFISFTRARNPVF